MCGPFTCGRSNQSNVSDSVHVDSYEEDLKSQIADLTETNNDLMDDLFELKEENKTLIQVIKNLLKDQ